LDDPSLKSEIKEEKVAESPKETSDNVALLSREGSIRNVVQSKPGTPAQNSSASLKVDIVPEVQSELVVSQPEGPPAPPIETSVNIELETLKIAWDNEEVQELLRETNQMFVGIEFLGLPPEYLETQSILLTKDECIDIGYNQGTFH
jgi:hypothetical protein